MKVASVGTVKNRAFQEDDTGLLRKAMESFEGKRVRFIVEEVRKRRSTEANAYYWAVVVPMIGEAMGMQKWEKDKVHAYLKLKFNYRILVGRNGEEERIPETTTDLSSAEFSQDYIEAIRQFGAEFFGIEIPDPIRVGY